MDKWLAAIAVLILFLCSLLLLDDLRVLQLPFLSRTSAQTSEPIGKLLRSDKDVRRRGQSEIIWQDTEKDSPVYANDSVLTLSESGAILKIGENGTLELGENTLVVLEKLDHGGSDEIRLLFKRGRVSSKGGRGEIESGEWEVKFNENSKFEIRASGNDKFELDVKEGQIQVSDNKGQTQLINEKSVRLEKDKLVDLKIDPELKFLSKNPYRVYFHQARPLNFKWFGNADHLIIDDAPPVPIANKSSMEISLALGLHQMRLLGANGQSDVLRAEIRKAPVIHLYAPLPRDRVLQNHTVSFEWRKIDTISKYIFEISDKSDFSNITIRKETDKNSIQIKFDKLGRFFWRTRGLDQDGYDVPELYNNEIYSVEDPLDAPEVDENERYPAESRLQIPGFWLNIFMALVQNAHALENEFIFEWKAVKGAEKYLIEIDDDPYFQSPEVMTEVKSPTFSWTPKRRSTVHWRVAADSKGRMGLFSPVQTTDLSKVRSNSKLGHYSVRVANRKPAEEDDTLETPEPLPLPSTEVHFVDTSDKEKHEPVKETPVFPPSELPPVKEEANLSGPKRNPFGKGWLWYGPQYANRSYSASGIDEAKLYGIELVNFGGSLNASPQSWDGRFGFRFTQSQYVVKDKRTHPFQETLTLNEYDIGYSAVLPGTSSELGLQVSNRSTLKKTALEAFEIVPVIFAGPTIKYGAAQPSGGWSLGAALLFGDNGFAIPAYAELWSSPESLQGGTFGLRIEYDFQSGETKGNSLKVMIPVGYSW